MNPLQNLIKENQLWYCLDCGKCGSVCPVTRASSVYTSPRTLIETAVHRDMEAVISEPLFWACLTCKRCSDVCPSNVHFAEFVREARTIARPLERRGDCTHGEVIQTWGRMMTNPAMRQKRLDWISADLKIAKKSDTLFFTGCAPYFEPMFAKLGVQAEEGLRAAVRILNHLGIQPQVLADERCCGHDQLWEGDTDTFRALAALNLEKLKASGAKRIVSACPECVRTLKLDYPQYVGSHGLEVMHISELLAESGIPLPEADSNSPAMRVTFQDPCRLGRHLGVFDPPRQVLAALGLELSEMAHHAGSSQCCGTSCWRACGQVSKRLQVERLEEARDTGAEVLVTTCLKCQIHLKCAQNDPLLGEKIHIPIRDLTTLVAEKLTGQPQHAKAQEVPVGQR